MLKFLIACSGKATRWGNYLGTAKHLIKIDNERLIDRTVRLLRNELQKKRLDGEICIVAPSYDDAYKVVGSSLIVPAALLGNNDEKEKYWSLPFIFASKELWNNNGCTILMFGDVYFTEFAVKTIVDGASQIKQCEYYGRSKRSKLTGCRYGELFSIAFKSEFNDELLNCMTPIKQQFDGGVIKRFSGWEVLRMLTEKQQLDRFVEIDDWTEDFDYPKDYDTFIKLFMRARKRKMVKRLMRSKIPVIVKN